VGPPISFIVFARILCEAPPPLNGKHLTERYFPSVTPFHMEDIASHEIVYNLAQRADKAYS
jgi:hypothetical protein